MALQTIDEEGNLTWNCPHMPEEADNACGTANSAHISHEHIKWHGLPATKPEHRSISLPPCSGCKAQTFLKVAFTEKELKAPNMWLPWTSEMETQQQRFKDMLAHAEAHAEQYKDKNLTTIHLDLLKQQIEQLEAMKQAGGSHTNTHAMALRHVELAKQLVASGKLPTEQGET